MTNHYEKMTFIAKSCSLKRRKKSVNYNKWVKNEALWGIFCRDLNRKCVYFFSRHVIYLKERNGAQEGAFLTRNRSFWGENRALTGAL